METRRVAGASAASSEKPAATSPRQPNAWASPVLSADADAWRWDESQTAGASAVFSSDVVTRGSCGGGGGAAPRSEKHRAAASSPRSEKAPVDGRPAGAGETGAARPAPPSARAKPPRRAAPPLQSSGARAVPPRHHRPREAP